MSVIYIVLPVALVVVAIAVVAYVWAAKRGQFDDLTTPAIRMLNDDAPARVEAPKPADDDARPSNDRAPIVSTSSAKSQQSDG